MCTRQEREKRVSEALAINSLDAAEPSEECMELLEDYMDGSRTIEENKESIINRYLNQKEDKPI